MRTMDLRAALALALALAGAPAFAQSVSNGQALYGQTCISCHGLPPQGGPELAPNNPSLIKSAINTLVPSMSFLRGMYSDSQLADIAAYIASLRSGVVTPPPPPVPAFDYTDLWWNPAESGWGFNIIQHASNNIFAVIYTYDEPNRPMWYVLPGGTWTSPVTFTGNLFRVTGSPATLPFNGGDVVQVGTATLLFSGANDATLTYSVNGVQVSKVISRQLF
jgi:cytochrome c553